MKIVGYIFGDCALCSAIHKEAGACKALMRGIPPLEGPCIAKLNYISIFWDRGTGGGWVELLQI